MTIEYKDSKRIITYPSVDAYWDFDGSDYVDLGNTILSGTGAFSSMAVIKVDSAGSGSRDIWSNYRSSATGGNQLYVLSTNKVSYYQGSGNTSHTAGTALTDDTWYNVIIVNDGSTSTIYINGTSDGATSQSASVSGSNMQIGGLDSSGTFDGGIADVAFWSRALTTAEITALQSDPNPSNLSSTSNLISYYNFEQTSGNLIDQVGSNNGTNNGATQTGTRNVAQAKPTDVQDNSILVEKDTAKRYWFTGESSETLSQETESGTGELFNDVEIVAQKFTSGSSKIGKKVSSVAFYLKRNTSTIGSTNLQCFVGAGNQSSAVAYGTLPATSLTTSYAWYTFTPSVAGTERTLVADDRIMIRWADGSTISDAVRIASDQSGNNPLANETGQYSDDDGSSFTDRSFDYMYKIISTTPATWTKDRQVTSGSAMTAGGGTSSATTNAQTSSNYVWTNIASISTARLYTFGTGNASNFTIGGSQNVENSETWNGSSWATAISTDTQRRDTTATAGSYNDMIVAYGRNNAGTLLNSSSTFNGTTWSAGVTANTAREHPCGAGQSDSMLIAGGYDSSAPSTSVDSYNGTTFTTETVLPTASYGQNMGASASNSAHIAGGATAMSGTYDGTTWTNTTELSVSTTHYFAGGGGDRDEHLVMGGYISSGTNYDTTWLWNGTSWVSKNALTTAKRAGAGDCTAR